MKTFQSNYSKKGSHLADATHLQKGTENVGMASASSHFSIGDRDRQDPCQWRLIIIVANTNEVIRRSDTIPLISPARSCRDHLNIS